MALNYLTIPYEIEHENVGYCKSWITCHRFDGKVKFKNVAFASDFSPQNDGAWTSRIGYVDYLQTEKGPKKVELINKDKKHWFTKFRDCIRRIRKILVRMKEQIIRMLGLTTPDKGRGDKVIKTDSKVAMTIIPTTAILVSDVSAMVEASYKLNAKSDIKKVNKISSNFQVNKYLAKVGPSGNKEILSKTTSDAFNAYMTGITSYNVTDAIAMANNIAALEYRSKKNMLLGITLLVIIATSLFTSSIVSMAIAMGLVLADYFFDLFKGNVLFYTMSMLMCNTIVLFMVHAIFAIVESTIRQRRTALYRSVLYIAITCIIIAI